MTLQWSSS